jgi:four helix bundle protein
MKKPNVIRDKSLTFAIEIVRLSKELQEQKEFLLSKQLMRSGTSIGALVREAEQAESKKDFIHKLSIALKEANETEYWLEILRESGFIDDIKYDALLEQVKELLRLLTSIIKTSKSKI